MREYLVNWFEDEFNKGPLFRNTLGLGGELLGLRVEVVIPPKYFFEGRGLHFRKLLSIFLNDRIETEHETILSRGEDHIVQEWGNCIAVFHSELPCYLMEKAIDFFQSMP